jgi:phosphatidylserine/phosphatidylglycerophosphate/cardiolipin synthase-like enzyme
VLSIFRCDDEAVLHALADAVRRGVRVRAIVTSRAKASARDLDHLRTWLAAHGIAVRGYAAADKYHAKYLVADDRTALVASLNLTTQCLERTCDFMLVTGDADVVSGLTELFAADWAQRAAVLTRAQMDRLIIGPDYHPRDRFAFLVREARQRIRVLDAKLTDPGIQRLLESRRGEGVAVEIARGHDVHPLTAHGRLLIIDDHAAVVGSFALSRGALERRRELAVITRDAAVLRELDAFWRAHSRRRAPSRVTVSAAPEMRP